jgi:GDP-4-dehydro-6-deoxy-D-mannose reductase
MDIMDPEMTLEVISRYKPDVLINMAGQANVGLSWKKPQLTVSLNTIGLINILEAVRQVSPQMRVITVGSSDEYGSLGERGADVTEDMPVNPMTPYAISKSAQDQFANLYNRAYGMNVCMIRFFNLVGAGQAKGFMVPDFSSGIVEVERGQKEYLSVGNLESARDFTHVRDAVRAVRLVAEKGHAGEIYNICSGRTYKASEILDKLISKARADIEVRQDPSRMRPSDTPVVCGNHDKLTAHTGWQPEISIDEVLEEVLEYWRNRID